METISRRLRGETRDLHDEVEHRLGLPASLRERNHLFELLRRWQVLFAEIEAEVGAVEGPSGAAPVASASAVLTVDLERLGLATAVAPGEPLRLVTAEERAGAAYVLAWSLLGVASVARSLPPAWTGGVAFLNAVPAAGAPTMTVVRQWLDAWPDPAFDDLLRGSRLAFTRAGDVLGAGPWSDALPGPDRYDRIAVEAG
jgi:heme oxygenase